MTTLDGFATVACATKRSPAFSGSKRGSPAAYLTGLYCTPLDPLDPNIRFQPGLRLPIETLQTFLDGNPDIEANDLLTVGGVDYLVQSVAEWTWDEGGTSDTVLQLIVEQVK